MNKTLTKLASLAAVGTLTVLTNVEAASDTANATATVIAAIGISQVSDLTFDEAVPGAAADTVAAGTSENSNNASFTVTGEANHAYSVTLPSNSTVVMETGAGGANETIAVDDFTSDTANSTYNLGAGASQTLFVGATRAALGGSQVTGAYTTTFTVTVDYP